MLAAARFSRSPSATGGRGDWISAAMKPISIVMGRLDHDLPRQLVVAVTAERIYLLPVSRSGVGPEVASWSRFHVKSSAARAGGGWAVWIQPPGDRAGFELRGKGGLEADAVVAALMKEPD
ncbi:MAG: hypothetical protein ACRD2W_05025 [Acidimicrobiales bacterium]